MAETDATLPLACDAPLDVFPLEAFPGRVLRVALFCPATNGAELASALAAAGGGPAVEPAAAYVNARLVASGDALLLAAHKALCAEASPRGLASRGLHSELLLCLSPGGGIADALRRWGPGGGGGGASDGASASVPALLVARFDGTPDEALRAAGRVAGTRVPLARLGLGAAGVADAAALRHAYRPLTAAELARGSLEEAVLSRIGGREVA